MPALDDIYSVTAVGRCIDQTIMLTHHYRLSAFPAGATDITVRDRLIDFMRGDAGGDDIWETPYLAAMPQNYELQFWQVQKVRGTRGAYRQYARGTPGLLAVDARTANVAGVVTLKTDFGGRNQISNKHVGPLPDNAVYYTAGSLTALMKGFLTTLQGGLLSFCFAALQGWQFDPVILHKTGPTISNTLTTGIVQPTVRVMRRRTVGLGI
jgi:hypothetical protein